MIDYDGLFKKLISQFFPEFIELFFADISNSWDKNSLEFLPQEIFSEIPEGEKKIIDLLFTAQWRNQQTLFIIHVEHQSYTRPNFNQRMFRYFTRLHEKYCLPVYPIVIYSHDAPKTLVSDSYRVELSGWTILEFHYKVIQLNRLNWQDFVNERNPVASALMSKMRMSTTERPTVKLMSLQMLSSLGLNYAQVKLISGFIDTYLKLNDSETVIFEEQLARIEPRQKEEVIQIVTSWMEEGLQQGRIEGRVEGREQEAVTLVLRLLKRRFGTLDSQLEEEIQNLSTSSLEDLAEALLDFTSVADLQAWLQAR